MANMNLNQPSIMKVPTDGFSAPSKMKLHQRMRKPGTVGYCWILCLNQQTKPPNGLPNLAIITDPINSKIPVHSQS